MSIRKCDEDEDEDEHVIRNALRNMRKKNAVDNHYKRTRQIVQMPWDLIHRLAVICQIIFIIFVCILYGCGALFLVQHRFISQCSFHWRNERRKIWEYCSKCGILNSTSDIVLLWNVKRFAFSIQPWTTEITFL